MLIWPKNFFFAKFEYGYRNNAEFLRWFRSCWEKFEKFANKNVIGKKVCKIWVCPFYTTDLLKFLAKKCWWVHFFLIIFTDLKLALNSAYFWHSYEKKVRVIEYIFEYFLELVECKFSRNGLTSWKTFLTNICKNIIWHLFADESYKVVKITVTYKRIKPEKILFTLAGG